MSQVQPVRFRWLLRLVLAPLQGVMMRLAVRVNPACQVGGLDLIDISGRAVSVDAPQRLQNALTLMGQADPAMTAGVKRRLRRVLVAPGTVGYYSPSVEAAVIGTAYFTQCTSAQLALVIVHEAAHARLRRLGIRTRRRNRERIERICLRAELALARKLPQSDKLVAEIRAKSTKPWWTEEIAGQRLASIGHASNLPGWMTWLLRKMPRWTSLA